MHDAMYRHTEAAICFHISLSSEETISNHTDKVNAQLQYINMNNVYRFRSNEYVELHRRPIYGILARREMHRKCQ